MAAKDVPLDSDVQDMEVEIVAGNFVAEEEERWQKITANFGLRRLKEESPDEALRLMLKGVPDRLRSQVWSSLLISDDADPLKEDSTLESLDARVLRQINADLPRTFPTVPSFDEAREQQLGQLLRTYAYDHPDIGYCQSMNYVAGLLLLVFEDVSAAYSAFLVFMQIFALSGLYIEGLPLMLTYSCATLRRMKDSMPELHDHFCRVNFRFPQFPCAWFMSAFVKLLPLPLVKRFWDLLVLEGGDVLVTLCVIVLKTLRPFLLCLEEDDVSKFLDFIRMPSPNSWQERFWLRLFDQQLAGGAHSFGDFQREHQCVREILANTPGSIDVESLAKDFSYPSRTLLAEFLLETPEETLETAMPAVPANGTSTALSPAEVGLSRWEGLRQTFSAVSTEMSWEMRDGMRRLNKILAKPAKPESRNGYK